MPMLRLAFPDLARKARAYWALAQLDWSNASTHQLYSHLLRCKSLVFKYFAKEGHQSCWEDESADSSRQAPKMREHKLAHESWHMSVEKLTHIFTRSLRRWKSVFKELFVRICWYLNHLKPISPLQISACSLQYSREGLKRSQVPRQPGLRIRH